PLSLHDALPTGEGAREVRRARDEAERQRFWNARKKSFGALGRLAPDLLVQDAVVPRSKLPAVLARIYEVAAEYGLTVANVFHAGDGNLHPCILFDRRDADVVARGERASRERMHACVEAGGTITGEHAVGYATRESMSLMYGAATLEAMGDVRWVSKPRGLADPGKLFPVRVCREWEGPAAVVARVVAAERRTAGGGVGGGAPSAPPLQP